MKRILLIITILFTADAFAQGRISDYNTIGWYTTNITPRISKKFSGHIEYQWRREDWIQGWQQSLLRVGLNYALHPQVTAHIGYGWILTYPYGDIPLASVPKTFPEHRLYEQLVVKTPVGKLSLQHRLRIEQRWVGKFKSMADEKPTDWVMLNRLRYMPRLDIPLYKNIYAAIFDEIFIGLGKSVAENIFDQNRISVLAGYKFTERFRAEAGFINQTVQLGREIAGRNVFQYNNGLLLNTYLQLN